MAPSGGHCGKDSHGRLISLAERIPSSWFKSRLSLFCSPNSKLLEYQLESRGQPLGASISCLPELQGPAAAGLSFLLVGENEGWVFCFALLCFSEAGSHYVSLTILDLLL